VPGQMVSVEITRWPASGRGAVGRVTDVLGDIDAPGVDTEIIIRKYNIPDAHSDEAVAEAVRLGGAVSERDIKSRTDFRSVPTVTIDGEHARDFDDAITIEKLANGNYWLGVHIADVSQYVKEGFDFLAIKLLPNQGVQAMRPVRGTMRWAGGRVSSDFACVLTLNDPARSCHGLQRPASHGETRAPASLSVTQLGEASASLWSPFRVSDRQMPPTDTRGPGLVGAAAVSDEQEEGVTRCR